MTGKHSKQGQGLLCRLKAVPLLGAEVEMLANGDFRSVCICPYKRVTSALFLWLLLYPLCSKNNQLKMIPVPKRHIFGWHILLPFTITLFMNIVCRMIVASHIAHQ